MGKLVGSLEIPNVPVNLSTFCIPWKYAIQAPIFESPILGIETPIFKTGKNSMPAMSRISRSTNG